MTDATARVEPARRHSIIQFLYPVLGPILLAIGVAVWVGWYWWQSDHVKARYPDFIVLVSVTWTAIYAFMFIIAPQFHHTKGLRTIGVIALALSLFVSLVISSILFSVYLDKTFADIDAKQGIELYAVSAFRKLFKPLSGEHWVQGAIDWFIHFHFLVFVGMYIVVDVIFAWWSPHPADRRNFRRLVFVVDIPIFIAVAVTIISGDHLTDVQRPIFEAGAISFQLITGNIAAYVLENYWIIRRLRRWSRYIRRRGQIVAAWVRGITIGVWQVKNQKLPAGASNPSQSVTGVATPQLLQTSPEVPPRSGQ